MDADLATTYRAARELDLTQVGGALVKWAFQVRGIPERMGSRGNGPPRVPTRMTLDDLSASSDWVILGERPSAEVAFGAVGRFWKPVIEWHEIEPRDFTDFTTPGWGKIACSLSVQPYGQNRTLLTYDVRTILNDPLSWVRFRRYWHLIGPFVGMIERAALRTIAAAAEHPGRD
ncbi:hypothetical protein [Umezawaea sp. Da 62-37]|uniref:hypothetical protein n=1 Tax=Umezawaea sp. Da 62-37 TaxID=3075927 RepID=UPI0028F6DE5E|nr:hypothetical protein [Umezawaea sp. Da 62-37]WNV84832.1 hypothetical protein RM788_42830 [Umezawaea sp. Da 62-37]